MVEINKQNETKILELYITKMMPKINFLWLQKKNGMLFTQNQNGKKGSSTIE